MPKPFTHLYGKALPSGDVRSRCGLRVSVDVIAGPGSVDCPRCVDGMTPAEREQRLKKMTHDDYVLIERTEDYKIIMIETRYAFVCLHCGWTSYSVQDVSNHYCGYCHQFYQPAKGGIDVEG